MTFCKQELERNRVDALALEARELRRRLKLTQREFAAMAEVSLSTVQRFELGDPGVGERAAAKVRGLLERWRLKPPTPRRETRGRKRRPANDVTALGETG